MKAYNGQYSCTCLDEGDNTIGAHAGNRYWPYNLSCQIRTLAEVNVAYNTGCCYKNPITLYMQSDKIIMN